MEAPPKLVHGQWAELPLITSKQMPLRPDWLLACLCVEDVGEHATGLLAGVLPEQVSDGPNPADGPKPADRTSLDSLHRYRDVFGDRGYLMAELHKGPDDRARLQRLTCLARQVGLSMVAAGDVHYHAPGRSALHDVLTAIRHGTTVAQAAGHLFCNAQRHLKSPETMELG